MRFLFLLVLASLTVEAAPPPGRFARTNSRTPQGRSTRGLLGDELAFFEFAPATGAGMGSACACTSPTGAKGEALTFTRGSSATCTATATGGLATTGIANGDLVTCTSNQPRVEYDSAGVKGLLVESSRTNSAIRSQEFDDAAWVKSNAGVVAPVVTANYATAPDGTMTADRLEVPACALTTNYSMLVQTIASSAAAESASIYLRGTSGSGSVTLCHYGAAGNCAVCAFTASSWSRCVLENKTGAASSYVQVGCENRTASYTGASNTGIADVLLWGGQLERSAAYATSYIPTTSAAVTRSAEVAYLSTSLAPGSIAASVQVPWSSASSNLRVLRVDASASDNDRMELMFPSLAKLAIGVSVSASYQQTDSSNVLTLPGTHRGAAWRTPATTQAVIANGTETSQATALGAFPTLNRVYVGAYAPATGFEPNGIISQICVDPVASRCR